MDQTLAITATNGYGYGYVPDSDDNRDLLYATILQAQPQDIQSEIYKEQPTANIPDSKYLDKGFPAPYNQLGLGSCVANATCMAVRYAWKQAKPEHADYNTFNPSRLALWWYARTNKWDTQRPSNVDLYDYTPINTGTQIRYAVHILQTQKICSEDKWKYPDRSQTWDFPNSHPYKIVEGKVTNEFVDTHPARQMPPNEGMVDFDFEYFRIRDVNDDPSDPTVTGLSEVAQMQACIAEGFPIVFGFNIYDGADFGALQDNPVVWPSHAHFAEYNPNHGEREGGHAVLVTGYDRTQKQFRCLNSWGSAADWAHGDNGFFWLPYSWFTSKGQGPKDMPTNDLWVIRPKGYNFFF